MAELGFALYLGGGLYMDSDGELHHGAAPPGVPVYKAPFALPFDPDKVSKALKDVGDVLKGVNKEPQLLLQLHIWGAQPTILNILSVIGKIAGAFAPVFAALPAAIELLKIMGFIKDGPSALELSMNARFDELDAREHAIAQMIIARDLRKGRDDVEIFVSDVKDFVGQRNQLTQAQFEGRQDHLMLMLDNHVAGFAALLDQQTWNSDFQRREHTIVWPPIQHVTFTLPGGPADPPAPAPLPPNGTFVFDARLMVPLASYAAESYLACIRGIVPEYRSTGDFRDHLRSFARKLDDLAQAMRIHELARTIYAPAHFAPIVAYYDVVAGPAPGELAISPTCNRWPVGALDLRVHNDAFFWQFLTELWQSEQYGWVHDTKFAGMNMRWIPPAKLVPAEFGNYRISNPEECAAAANAQAEQDYAMLLALSGYPELLRLAALFRNEATEPATSQTVAPGAPGLYRHPLPSSTVTVKSRPVFLTGEVISATARREPQQCMATIAIATQPLKRALPAQYRVMLRTLRSPEADTWVETEYSDYQRADYEPDPANPGFLRLALTTTSMALGEHPIVPEWQISPRGSPIHRPGVAQLEADTFDWWIPVAAPLSIDSPTGIELTELHAYGKLGKLMTVDPHLPGSGGASAPPTGGGGASTPPASGSGPGAIDHAGLFETHGYIPELSWISDAQDWDGQHREMVRKTVRVEYILDWDGARLDLTVKGDPADRSYVVYVVVEEMLTGSGQVLHTAVKLPINGLLTYVPQAFFDEEFRANALTARAIYELMGRYIPSAGDIHPPGPIGWTRPGDLVSSAAMQRIVDFAREQHPDLFRLMLDSVKATRSRQDKSSPPSHRRKPKRRRTRGRS
jgi:hypothetical protein